MTINITYVNTRTRFFATWTVPWGNLVGWMRLRDQLTGIDMVHVAGELLGLAIFPTGAEEVDTERALSRFIMALKMAAGDLGVDMLLWKAGQNVGGW